jgi:hypothetical protein
MKHTGLPELASRVLDYQGELSGFFTGSSMENDRYREIRHDLLTNDAYAGKIPSFVKRCRDTSSLWSFAKGVDPSWEPRRKFIRAELEPLLDYLEEGGAQPPDVSRPNYDSSAWTGVHDRVQQAKAIRTLIPCAQAAVEALIKHLETPNHNGSPPLDDAAEAIEQLKLLHEALGRLLAAIESDGLAQYMGEGLPAEIARYVRRAARSLRHDPLPYALSGMLLATLTACGFPGLGGFSSGVAANIRKPEVA